MRHERGDMGTLLAFASRPPPLAAIWRARCGSRLGFARRVPTIPRRPPVGGNRPLPRKGVQSRTKGTAHAGSGSPALDRSREELQLDRPEFLERPDRPIEPEGFRCELVNPFTFPAQFAGTREDGAEEIVPVIPRPSRR